jgi:hypothetical protein
VVCVIVHTLYIFNDMSQATSVLIQATFPLSLLTSMSANDSTSRDAYGPVNDSNQVANNADAKDGKDVDPLLMSSIWHDVKIQKTCSADGKKSWKCGYCNNSFSGHNATKAVAHLCRTKGQDIAGCKQYHFIPVKHRQSHQDLSDRKSIAKRKRKVMHETLDRSINVHQQHLAVAVQETVCKKHTPGDSTSTTASTLSASVISTLSGRALCACSSHCEYLQVIPEGPEYELVNKTTGNVAVIDSQWSQSRWQVSSDSRSCRYDTEYGTSVQFIY